MSTTESAKEAREFLEEYPTLESLSQLRPKFHPWTENPDDPIPLASWLYLREQLLAGQGAAELMGLKVDGVKNPLLLFCLPLELTPSQLETFQMWRGKLIPWFQEYFDQVTLLPEQAAD